jgi:hypothetical protein
METEKPKCRVCGCTDDDCSGCIEKTGEPCYWVEKDLCSACAGESLLSGIHMTIPVPEAKINAGALKKLFENLIGAWREQGEEIGEYLYGWLDVVTERTDNETVFTGKRSRLYYYGRSNAVRFLAGKRI